jgi:hypothetical protein
MVVLFGDIMFRKPGAFDVAEQHSKHPIFLQTEEASRCGNLSIEWQPPCRQVEQCCYVHTFNCPENIFVVTFLHYV